MSQLVYFPYLGLKNCEKIKLGDIEIWNFDKLNQEKIPDPQLREYVKKLIEANQEGDGPNNKIQDIGVVSIGDTDFRQFNSEESYLIQEAKIILFLARIAITNTTILGSGADGWSLATSENFEPVYQNFQLGNDHISERAGVITPIGIGGYTIGEKRFFKPSHVLISPYGLRLDGELIRQLYRLKTRQKKLFRRIIRATELVFQSYYNSPNITYNSRILLIAAAFETLLNLPEPARKNFKDAVEKFCDTPGETKFRHWYSTRAGKKRDRNRSIKVLWADSFFELRNQIIHGDYVPWDLFLFRSGNRQHDISILFYCLLVKKLINDKLPRPAFYDAIKWKDSRRDSTRGFSYDDRSVEVALRRMRL